MEITLTQELKDTCLYIHTRKDDGGIFYVGIGDKKRPYHKDRRSKFWKSVVKKHGGYDVKIIKTDMCWVEACDLETKMIAFYGRIRPNKKNLNYGCLVNLTDGGEGTKGHIKSKEAIEKIRETSTGRKKSEESKQKMRERMSGEGNPMFGVDRSGEKNPRFGVIVNEETRQKMRENYVGPSGENHPKSRKVICSVTGKTYNTVNDAAKDTGVKYNTLRDYLNGRYPNKTSLRFL